MHSEILNGILIYRGHNSQNRPIPILAYGQQGVYKLPVASKTTHRGHNIDYYLPFGNEMTAPSYQVIKLRMKGLSHLNCLYYKCCNLKSTYGLVSFLVDSTQRKELKNDSCKKNHWDIGGVLFGHCFRVLMFMLNSRMNTLAIR